MAKFQILTYNNISAAGLERFDSTYDISDNAKNPDAILLRSFDLHDSKISESVAVVGRAGAGVNNIPVEKYGQKGIVVMNTPGANANAVNELVIVAMLMTARNLPEALAYSAKLNTKNIKEAVEKGKKQFAGSELRGKTVGIIGLGAIGQRVSVSAKGLGMKVIGFDPYLSPKQEKVLPDNIKISKSLEKLLGQSDFVTIHVPLLDSTKGLIGKKYIKLMQPHTVLLNFSRDELVDEPALLHALDTGKLASYVTDFPNKLVLGHARVIALPHLGASTAEAEDNCAIMIADQVKEFLQTGNIRNSVNYPNASLNRVSALRLTFLHKNEPGVVANITKMLSQMNINIAEILNESRGQLAYTIIDLDSLNLPVTITKNLETIPGIFKLRIIN